MNSSALNYITLIASSIQITAPTKHTIYIRVHS